MPLARPFSAWCGACAASVWLPWQLQALLEQQGQAGAAAGGGGEEGSAAAAGAGGEDAGAGEAALNGAPGGVVEDNPLAEKQDHSAVGA